MKNNIIIIISLIMLSSCTIFKSHEKWLFENKSEICITICSQPIDTETNVSTKDTVYTTIDNTYLGADSMMLFLYLYCDSSNQVMIKNSELLQSQYGRMILTHNKDVFTIRALYDSIEVKNKTIHEIKTKTINIVTKVPVYVEKIVREKYIPWWVFVIFGASGIIIIYLLIRKLFI